MAIFCIFSYNQKCLTVSFGLITMKQCLANRCISMGLGKLNRLMMVGRIRFEFGETFLLQARKFWLWVILLFVNNSSRLHIDDSWLIKHGLGPFHLLQLEGVGDHDTQSGQSKCGLFDSPYHGHPKVLQFQFCPRMTFMLVVKQDIARNLPCKAISMEVPLK